MGESSPNTHINEEHHPYEDVHPGPAGEGRVEDPGLVKVLLHPNNLGIFNFLEEDDCQDQEESEADLKDGWRRGILKISQKARHYTSHCNMIVRTDTFRRLSPRFSSKLATRNFERDPFLSTATSLKLSLWH